MRRCIGATFAQFEIKTVLRAVLANAQLAADDPAPEPQRTRHVTVVPGRDAVVVLEERSSSAAHAVPHFLSTGA